MENGERRETITTGEGTQLQTQTGETADHLDSWQNPENGVHKE